MRPRSRRQKIGRPVRPWASYVVADLLGRSRQPGAVGGGPRLRRGRAARRRSGEHLEDEPLEHLVDERAPVERR